MAIREVLTSFTFEQQRLMINLIGTDVGDTSTLLTPTNVVVPALNEIVNGDVDLVNQTHGMDPGTSGSPSLYWDAGQGFYKVDASKIGLTSSLAITGNLEVDGDITFRAGAGAGGTLTFGDLNTDNIIFNADVQSSIVPDTTANYNLGTAAKQWNNLWIDGTASIDTLTVDENSQFIGYIAVGSGDIRVPSTQTTVDLFDDYATTVEAFGDGTDIRLGATTGTLTLRNPTIVGSETTQNLFNTVATTVNAFGAATTINMGVSGGGGNTNFNILSDDVVCSGDLNINGGELLSQQTTFNLLINNDNINVGNATGQGTTTINNRLQINGNLAIGGTSTYIELPDNQTNAFRFREGSNDYLQFRTEDGLERVVVWKDLYVVGNLDVSGTETVIDTTTLLVEDKNIELGASAAPSDATADGGGITLKATTDKTITYNNTSGNWETNIGLNVGGDLEVGTGVLTVGSGANTATQRAALLGGYTTFENAAGTGNPSITFNNDTDTGLLNPSADTLAFNTGGSERLRIDSAGNMGLGVTPIAPGSTTLHIGESTSGDPVRIHMTTNATGATSSDGFTLSIDGSSSAVNLIQRETADMQFYTANTLRLTINGTGDVTMSDGRLTVEHNDATSADTMLLQNTTSGGDNRVLINTFANGGGDPYIRFDAGGSNMLIGEQYNGTTNNKLVLGVGETPSAVAGLSIDGNGFGTFDKNITLPTGTATADSDHTIDAATNEMFSITASFTTTRSINISNLTDGRKVIVHIRNTNGSTRSINILASTTTSGFAAVNMMGANTGAPSVTAANIGATSGTLFITVANIGGTFCGHFG